MYLTNKEINLLIRAISEYEESINNMNELNIGHSIVSRALAVGLERAVREMKTLISVN